MGGQVTAGASAIHGTGVIAMAALAQGEAVLRIDDTRVVTPEAPLRPELGEHDHHCDYLGRRGTVLMRWPERHINHSCDPNTYVRTLLGARYVFALRPIAAGAEITYDYCINGYGDTLWDCACGAARCRRRIHSDFFHLPWALQVEYLPLLDTWYVEEYAEEVAAVLVQVLGDVDANGQPQR